MGYYHIEGFQDCSMYGLKVTLGMKHPVLLDGSDWSGEATEGTDKWAIEFKEEYTQLPLMREAL